MTITIILQDTSATTIIKTTWVVAAIKEAGNNMIILLSREIITLDIHRVGHQDIIQATILCLLNSNSVKTTTMVEVHLQITSFKTSLLSNLETPTPV
jgi:hypothetical protein